MKISLNDCFTLNIATSVFSRKAQMNVRRHQHGISKFDSIIYVFGGM